MLYKSILTLLFSFLLSSTALAENYYVDIKNKTGYTIMYMYISPDKSKKWEEDVLGDDTLADGDTQRVKLRKYSSPIFDIRLIDEEDDQYTFWNVDVSRQNITVTLDDLD